MLGRASPLIRPKRRAGNEGLEQRERAGLGRTPPADRTVGSADGSISTNGVASRQGMAMPLLNRAGPAVGPVLGPERPRRGAVGTKEVSALRTTARKWEQRSST